MKKLFLGLLLISCSWALPTIGNFYFDGVIPWGSDAISPKALISIEVNAVSLNYSLFQLQIDGAEVLTKNASSWNYSYDISNKLFKYRITSELSAGRHSFRFVANDGADAEKTVYAFVAASQMKIVGSPIAYPSPATSSITIGYELTDTLDTEVYIYNINGMILYKSVNDSGSTGARAGYNAWRYDLKDASGDELNNGVYIAIVTSKINGEKKILGKTKFIVLR